MLNGMNKAMVETAGDLHVELDWEPTPSEVRENIDHQARIDIDTWLRTGETEHFKFFW